MSINEQVRGPSDGLSGFRIVLLLSRGPATLAAALALPARLSGAAGDVATGLLGVGGLLCCDLLLARADLMLVRPAG